MISRVCLCLSSFEVVVLTDIRVCRDGTTKNVDAAYFGQPRVDPNPGDTIATLNNSHRMDLSRQFLGTAVRVKGTRGDPLFCGKDVCIAAGLTNYSRVLGQVTKKYTRMVKVRTIRGKQTLKFLTEPGLYQLIMTSKGASKRLQLFREWVVEDVLPSLRKTGSYQIPQQLALMSDAHVQLGFVNAALARFPDDDLLMTMVNSTLKNQMGGNADAEQVRLTPIVVALERLQRFAPKFLRKYGPKAGKTAAAEFRAHFDGEPKTTLQYINGREVPVKCYTDDELSVLMPPVLEFLSECTSA